MATYLELKAQAEALMQQAEEARKKEIAEVVAGIKTKMQEYGITASDLGIAVSGKRAAKKVGPSTPAVVRYKNDKGETWSGMGRQPQWIKDAIEEGKSKEDFAV
ncbi:H-NS histone family protein [uncultured Acinetobacter sp.]|uniref:H-NS histone family protein n=1 Tax=uncultured Acinetobacter sp. TaxID=165433 RepID=UPI00262636B1|nr:H-NS histone family protein [uncultured Acinetobacter sp.]